MKKQIFLLYNYLIFIIIIIACWIICLPHKKYLSIDELMINDIKESWEKNLKNTICFTNPKPHIDHDFDNFVEKFANFTQISYDRSPNSTCNTDNTNEFNSKWVLSIECEKNSELFLEIITPFEFHFKVDCSISSDKSSKLFKTMRRALKYLTQEYKDDTQWDYQVDVYEFNVLYIYNEYQKERRILENSLYDENLLIKSYLKKYTKALGINEKQVKLTTKVIYEPKLFDYDSETDIWYIDANKRHSIDNQYHPPIHKTYFTPTQIFNIYIINRLQDNNKTYAIREENYHYDYIYENDYTMILHNDKNTLEKKISLSIAQFFKLDFIKEFHNTLLHGVNLKYNPHIPFEFYNHQRKMFFMNKILQHLDNLEYLIDEYELTISEEVGHAIDKTLQSLKNMSDTSTFEFDKLYTMASILNELNHGYSEDLAMRDTFPQEYLIGVYIPILAPFLYPLLKAAFIIYKKKRQKKILA